MEKNKSLYKIDGRTVLFVDDEDKILSCLKRDIVEEPYHALFANSGQEALDILLKHEVHVIVTDMRMPNMDGLELIRIVKDKYPHIIRMILSGYTDTDTLLAAVNLGEIFRFITKPWESNEMLKTTIRQAIKYYDLHGEREMLIRFFELWTQGNESEYVDIQFLKELVASHKTRVLSKY